MFQFKYHGGVRKPSVHSMEKFMLFFVVGGRELTFYDMKKNGFIESIDSPHTYISRYKHLKIFISEQGFGIRKRYISFYFELCTEGLGNKIKITPFQGEQSPFVFEGEGRFLKKSEVKNIITDENSLRFYENQVRPPKEELLKLIAVDRTHLQKDVRKITILKKE